MASPCPDSAVWISGEGSSETNNSLPLDWSPYLCHGVLLHFHNAGSNLLGRVLKTTILLYNIRHKVQYIVHYTGG